MFIYKLYQGYKVIFTNGNDPKSYEGSLRKHPLLLDFNQVFRSYPHHYKKMAHSDDWIIYQQPLYSIYFNLHNFSLKFETLSCHICDISTFHSFNMH